MVDLKATVLYSFEAKGPAELAVTTGEVVTIINQDVGDGWWRARSARGREGLIPSTYVELNSLPEPTMPPPPPPFIPPTQRLQLSPQQPQANEDEWDEEWDSDAEGDAATIPSAPNVKLREPSIGSRGEDNRNTRTLSQPGGPNYSESARSAVVRRAFGRTFAKTGGEDFLFATEQTIKGTNNEASVEERGGGVVQWKLPANPYECVLASPRKESKLKGIKSYIAYQLTPTFSRIQVSRRYKHFDWLHRRLQEKFICVCIPPLPDKQVTGRYDEHFIDIRQKQLQMWMNRMTKHPVVSSSVVMKHFLTCTDDRKWKTGKRDAERDPIQGAKFFYAVTAPPLSVSWNSMTQRTDMLEKFVVELERSNKNLLDVSIDFSRKQLGPIHKEFVKFGESFIGLSKALHMEPNRGENTSLISALDCTGETYKSIGVMFAVQHDADQLVTGLQEHVCLVSSMPPLVQLSRGAVTAVEESKRAQAEDRLRPDDVETMNRRAGVIAHAVDAELTWLRQERDADLTRIARGYLRDQITFYRNIVKKLEEAASKYGPES